MDLCNARDQIISILLLLQTTESHLCSRNVFFGIFKILELFLSASAGTKQCAAQVYQSIFFPFDSFLFVCVCVGKAFDLASLPSKKTMQTGTDLILSFLSGVALFATSLSKCKKHAREVWSIPGAYFEQRCTLFSITCHQDLVSLTFQSLCFGLLAHLFLLAV